MSEKIRAFFAIEIPNQDTLTHVCNYQNQLQKAIGPLKLVNHNLMHITSRFLGKISISQANQLVFFLNEELNPEFFSNGKYFTGNFVGVGNFRKNVFFVKICGVNKLLAEINTKINQYLITNLGFPPERGHYKPHLTIARAKRRVKSPDSSNPGQISYIDLKKKYVDYNFGKWDVKKVVLKKSVLTPKGPIYSNLN